jgi:hypothetical protein
LFSFFTPKYFRRVNGGLIFFFVRHRHTLVNFLNTIE